MVEESKARILIVEDDPHIAEGLRLNLSLLGYEVNVVADGVKGIEQWRAWRPDLVVLDVMLPGIDGLSVLQHIRLEDPRIPILILSAKATPADKVKGLSLGVDDYLAKPFELDEFRLRVERLLLRSGWREKGEAAGDSDAFSIRFFRFGPNSVDFDSGIAHCRQGRIRLTDQEARLLKLFIANRGKPLSRNHILEIGWGYTAEMTTRTVDNFIVRFRKYFEEDPKNPRYFQSIRSVGYLFDPGEN
ncbi:MAG: response regulator transcription factor [Desulfobacterales bacterium]